MAFTEQVTLKTHSIGGKTVSHTLEMSESGATFQVQAGTTKLTIASTPNNVRMIFREWREAINTLEQALERRHPVVQRLMLEEPQEEEGAA